MGRRTTKEDLEFIEKNWLSLSNVEIALSLGIDKVTVSQKGRKLGLPNKQHLFTGKYKRTQVSPAISGYGPGPESITEVLGRKKTLELKHIKELIEKNDCLKLRIREDKGSRILGGSIVQKTSELVVLQIGKYTESFKYVDFYTGRAIIM